MGRSKEMFMDIRAFEQPEQEPDAIPFILNITTSGEALELLSSGDFSQLVIHKEEMHGNQTDYHIVEIEAERIIKTKRARILIKNIEKNGDAYLITLGRVLETWK